MSERMQQIILRILCAYLLFVLVGLVIKSLSVGIGFIILMFGSLVCISLVLAAAKEPNDIQVVLLASVCGFIYVMTMLIPSVTILIDAPAYILFDQYETVEGKVTELNQGRGFEHVTIAEKKLTYWFYWGHDFRVNEHIEAEYLPLSKIGVRVNK